MPIRWNDTTPVLECGRHLYVDLHTGAVNARIDDAIGIGVRSLRFGRAYDSRKRAQAVSLGTGWSLVSDGVSPSTAKVDVRVRDGAIGAVDLTMHRARVCVRFFEVKAGHLWRVRNERDEVIEEYDYDGDLLVAARIGKWPTRYFEYDDRGRRARCVRTWSATGARDRMITYAGLRTIVDDATGATWIVERGPGEAAWLDPEMRRILPDEARHMDSSSMCRMSFDASGVIRTLEHPSLGAWIAQTDAIGRIVEVSNSSNRRIFFRREGEYVTVQSFHGVSLETTLTHGAGETMLLYDLHDSRSGFTMSARYDEDGALTTLCMGERAVQVQNDAEGRPTWVRFEDGSEYEITRDRAGDVRGIESDDGSGVPSSLESFFRVILEPSPESLLRHASTRPEPRLGRDSESHLREVLSALQVVLSPLP